MNTINRVAAHADGQIAGDQRREVTLSVRGEQSCAPATLPSTSSPKPKGKQTHATGVKRQGNGGKKGGGRKPIKGQTNEFNPMMSEVALKQRVFIGRLNERRAVTLTEIAEFNIWVKAHEKSLYSMVCAVCKKRSKYACDCRILAEQGDVPAPAAAAVEPIRPWVTIALPVAQQFISVVPPPVLPAPAIPLVVGPVPAAPTYVVAAAVVPPLVAPRVPLVSKPDGTVLAYFDEPLSIDDRAFQKRLQALPSVPNPALAISAPAAPVVLSGVSLPLIVERKARWWNRFFLNKKPSQMNYTNAVNHYIDRLSDHKAEHVSELVVPDCLVIPDLLRTLRVEMHTSYMNRSVKLEHLHKLAKKWAEKVEYNFSDDLHVNKFQVTIQKACDMSDNAYNYAVTDESLRRSRTLLGSRTHAITMNQGF